MRGMLIRLGIVAVVAGLSHPAYAGLYNSEEPFLVPTSNVPLFESILDDWKGIIKNPQSRLRAQYRKRVDELVSKERNGSLTVQDRTNLGAYYVRLGEYSKAVSVLEPATKREQRNFQVLSNLATAHELDGRLDVAIGYAHQAVAEWPSIWPGMDRQQLYWLGRVEKYHLMLLRLRQLEETRAGGRRSTPEKVDALFPKVRFTGPGGSYVAGDIDVVQLCELPSDSLAILEQLLYWTPEDWRLHWLFGEVLNAQGNILAARKIFDDLVKQGLSNKEISEHRKVINAAAEMLFRLNKEMSEEKYRNVFAELMWYAEPRGATLEPAVGLVANQSVWVARSILARGMSTPPAVAGQSQSTTGQPKSTSKWLPDVRHVVVSFVAGVLVTLLVTLQVKEMRRKHQSPTAVKG